MKHHVITVAILTGCAQNHTDTQTEREPESFATQAVAAEPSPDLSTLQIDTDLSGHGSSQLESHDVAKLDEAHTEGACATFTLRRGETLAHFARWGELPVETVAEHSHLDLNGQYPVGTSIMLPLEGEPLAAMNAARDAHHLERAESYLNRRGGSSRSEFLTVATGDTAWGIARGQLDIPVWLLETYNPSVDLESLKPGQELMYPVIGEQVTAEVEIEEPSEARLALQ